MTAGVFLGVVTAHETFDGSYGAKISLLWKGSVSTTPTSLLNLFTSLDASALAYFINQRFHERVVLCNSGIEYGYTNPLASAFACLSLPPNVSLVETLVVSPEFLCFVDVPLWC
ncbi:hypothetical protein NA56DRAFT_243619 [Hyaloscypha hepaticicola]|uniref:Uncharacterized protein n=1 Tax=Hyaloscypha hepaticicola TaxID=2082293 RepID=A0A2J6PWN4_9HELO|nr:hypothetical protein NA56DRAFT_243619 [Hyaloscypha hepaticicola]